MYFGIKKTNTLSHLYYIVQSIYFLSLTSFVSPVFSFSSCTVVRVVGVTAAAWSGFCGGDEVAVPAVVAANPGCVSISSVFIILALDSFLSVIETKDTDMRTNEKICKID